MFRNMGFNPYKLEHSSLDDVKNKFKELKQKRDELKEVPYAFSPRSFQSRLIYAWKLAVSSLLIWPSKP